MATQEEATLREAITRLTPVIEKYRRANINEAQVRTAMVEPILRALGWNTTDPEEVCPEYKGKSDYNAVDYALMVRGKVKLLIEAKRLGEDLRKGRVQLLGNASESGVGWGVQTDGDKYRVFKADGSGDAAERFFFEVSISGENDGTVLRRLGLLSRSSMEASPPKIENEWHRYHVDRDVRTTLQDMVDKADKKLVYLIRKRFCEHKTNDVATSLARLKVVDGTPPIGGDRIPPSVPTKTNNPGSGAPEVKKKPHREGYAAFRAAFPNSGVSVDKKALIESLIAQRVSPTSAGQYICWAKRDPKVCNNPARQGNPFGFQITETKDAAGRKILTRI